MRLPLDAVFRRGAVFRFGLYAKLDDPTLSGQTKPKFFVILNTSPADDPILYILATSQKEKHAHQPFMMKIEAGSYDFWPVTTLLQIADAEHTTIDRDEFQALYKADQIECVGRLEEHHIQEMVSAIHCCPSIGPRFKQLL